MEVGINHIKIEAGCTVVRNRPNTYRYQFYLVKKDMPSTTDPNEKINPAEYVGEIDVVFIAPEGQKPEIGDFIVDNVLVKRTEYQIAYDYRMWKERFEGTLEKDKMDDPKSWPDYR